jgi:hypothetical protein
VVSGRSAVASISGVPAVERLARALVRLGLEPLVVYPRRVRALGAELGGYTGEAPCMTIEQALASGPLARAEADEQVLMVAAGWYLSLRALADFLEAASGPCVATVAERGRVSAPLAITGAAAARRALVELERRTAEDVVQMAAGETPRAFSLGHDDQQRLSDSQSVLHAEDKAVARLVGRRSGWDPSRIKRALTMPLVRGAALRGVSVAWLGAGKIIAATLAMMVLLRPGYVAGLIGASLFVDARLFDSAASALARLRAEDTPGWHKATVASDVVLLVAVVWALVAHHPGAGEALVLGLVATAGIIADAAVAWATVLRPLWAARASGHHVATPDLRLTPRMAHGDGAAWGLAAAALLGRTDLFLWAAAIGSHAFWIVWLWSWRRSLAPGLERHAA